MRLIFAQMKYRTIRFHLLRTSRTHKQILPGIVNARLLFLRVKGDNDDKTFSYLDVLHK